MHLSAVFPRILLLTNSADRKVIKDTVHLQEPNTLFCVAQNEDEFLQRLYWIDYSIIIADYHFSNFLGLKAFLWAVVKAPYVPFVFITDDILPDHPDAEDMLELATACICRNKLPEIGGLIKHLLLEHADQIVYEEKQRHDYYNRCIQEQKLEVMLSKVSSPCHPTKFEHIYRKIKVDPLHQESSLSILNLNNIKERIVGRNEKRI